MTIKNKTIYHVLKFVAILGILLLVINLVTTSVSEFVTCDDVKTSMTIAGTVASAAAAGSTHPNMYLDINEIENIKNKVKANQQPWKTAYDDLISEANDALNTPIQSVTFGGKTPPSGDKHDYYTAPPYLTDGVYNPDADRTDYESAIIVGKSVRALGLAYAFTEDSKYADKAIQLIKGWAIDSDTRMKPDIPYWPGYTYQAAIEIPISMPGMFYGADLIWNYNGFSQTDKDALLSWTKDIKNSAKGITTPKPESNFENWRLLLISSAASLLEDSTDLQYAFDKWKDVIDREMASDGRMLQEIKRTRSLHYSLYAINAMIQTAEIARHNGVDLYNYKLPDGRGLELALDYHAQYVPYGKAPQQWPYEEISPDMIEYSLFELAYSFKQKQSYKDAIDRIGRPMYDTRTMGPVTLTHTSYFGQIPTGTATPGPVISPGPTIPSGTVSSSGPIRVICYKIKKNAPSPVSPTPTPGPVSPVPTPGPIEGEEIGTWKYGDFLSTPYGKLHNNVWGLTDEEKITGITKIYTYYKSNGNFGWEWNRPDPDYNTDVYVHPIEPEIIVGQPHGAPNSTTPYFSIKLGNINTWTSDIEYKYTKSPIGEYNLMYDIYFVDKNNPNLKHSNVMIWMEGLSLGTPVKTVTDGINEYDYYYRIGGIYDWPWHAFVLKNRPPQLSNESYHHIVDIKRLLEQLPPGSLDNEWIVPGIEFGSEVGDSSGRIEVSKFLINLNGNSIGKD